MKNYIRRWIPLGISIAMLPLGALAEESWDAAMQSRCHGNHAFEAPIDPLVAQGIGRCFLQLAQSFELRLESQRHLALQYADSWFAYATDEGLLQSTEERALTQIQLNQLQPIR